MTPNVKRQNATNELMEKCGVFWAFSREQFEEGKKAHPLDPGEKYVDIGMGGFIRKSKLDEFLAGMDAIDAEFKQAMKDEKARKAHIAYELDNHEAYYTRSIESTLDALGEGFTREEVLAVFDGRRKLAASRL